MNSPIISVVMPVFNEEQFVSEAIESILKQIYNNFEFIIINDASTDRSKEIINTFDDGRKCCGDICFGYTKNSKGVIVENPKESKVVKYIYKKYFEKKHLTKTKLSQTILKGCRRLGFTYRNGKELKSYHLKYFLQNQWYGGLQTFGENGIKKHYYPNIISKQLLFGCSNWFMLSTTVVP